MACPYIAAGGFTYDDGYKAAARIAQADDLPADIVVPGTIRIGKTTTPTQTPRNYG